jgi:hypothetical protein
VTLLKLFRLEVLSVSTPWNHFSIVYRCVYEHHDFCAWNPQHIWQIKLFEKRMSNIRVKEPKMFYLSVNYRSHAGIINCAHSIIDILQRFWKDSIDSLPKESGIAPGAKPIFYTTLSSEFIRKVSKSPLSSD